jgi:MFS family permease
MVISSTSPLICEQGPSTLIGASLGFLATTMDIGQTVGPVISGIILSSIFHYNAMFYSLSALLISSCLIFNFSKIAKNQAPPENKTQTTLKQPKLETFKRTIAESLKSNS